MVVIQGMTWTNLDVNWIQSQEDTDDDERHPVLHPFGYA